MAVWVAVVQDNDYPFELQTFVGATAEDAEAKAREANPGCNLIDPDDRFEAADFSHTYVLHVEEATL